MNAYTLALVSYIITHPTSALVQTMTASGPSNYQAILNLQVYQGIVGSWPSGQINVDPRVIARIIAVQQAYA